MPSVPELAQEIDAKRRELDADPRLWNGTQLALDHLDVSRLPDTEEPKLRMWFRKSDYATFTVVGDRWYEATTTAGAELDGNQLREVDPFLSNCLGINLTVETAEGRLVITKRSHFAVNWNGFWHISANEGLAVADLEPGGRVNIVGASIRAVREELGLDVSSLDDLADRLSIHTLALHVDRYQWGLLGHLDLRGTAYTEGAVRSARNFGAGHDDWEASDIRFIEFERSADSLVREITRQRSWIPMGLVCLALSGGIRHPGRAEELREALLQRSGR